MSIKKKYKVDNLHCPSCANEIIEKLEKINYIDEVFIDYDNNEITIVGKKVLSQEQVDKVIDEIIHHNHQENDLNHLHDVITEEFNFEDIDCPNCASKVERALNKESNIIDARVNFLNKKIIIKHLNNVEIYEVVSKIVSRVENGAKIYKNSNFHTEGQKVISDLECNCNNYKHSHHDHEHCSCNHKHNHNVNEDHGKKHCCCSHEDHHHSHKNNNEEHCNHEHNHKNNCECHNHNISCSCGHDHQYRPLSKNKKISLIIGIVSFIIATIISLIIKYGNLENKETIEIINYYLFAIGYLFIGIDIIYKSFKSIIHKDIFNENLLMTIASMGAMLINEPFEATMVILLYKIGEYLQNKATNKSKKAIQELLELKTEYVTLDNGEKKLVDDVNIGEIITVKVGERIPLDGTIKGEGTEVDMKALTGESKPIFIDSGDEILSGSINLSKVVQVEVTKESNESTISKMLKLVDEASNQKSKTEEFITKFARVYTPLVLIVAIFVGIIKAILNDPIYEIFNAIFSILVISCPCALVISIPLGYFAGIGKLSTFGVLVKGGNYLEALNNTKTFVFDKTGTITKGNFKVVEVNPVKGVSIEKLLQEIANVEKYSNHPIANSILDYYQNDLTEEAVEIEEISGKGLKLTKLVNNKNVCVLVGNEKLLELYNIKYQKSDSIGTIVYLSYDGNYYGNIVIRDEIKENSKETIEYLNKSYNTIMLTGDNNDISKQVAGEICIKEVYSQLLPKQKYQILKDVIDKSKAKVCYIGDGINDAPSLKLADVGIAMGGCGCDAAKETADIVIMNDDISKIKETIKVSKFTKKIIIQNIVMSLGIKIIAMIIGILGILGSYAMLLAVFADVGVCLLAILNTIRVMKIK